MVLKVLISQSKLNYLKSKKTLQIFFCRVIDIEGYRHIELSFETNRL
jgi:hypothetical protein